MNLPAQTNLPVELVKFSRVRDVFTRFDNDHNYYSMRLPGMFVHALISCGVVTASASHTKSAVIWSIEVTPSRAHCDDQLIL